jgi:hypothetical protein
MQHFLLWKPGWWIVHIVATVTVLYMGYMMR